MFGEISKNVELGNEFDLQEVKDLSINMISEYWICSKKKDEIEWIDFNGEKCFKDLKDFKRYTITTYGAYVTYIYDNWEEIVQCKNHKHLNNELIYIEQEGIACIYTSVLLYMMLKKQSEDLVQDINLIQGFYHHLLREDFFSFIPMNKNQQGLHCWLSYKSLIIDCSAVKQNKMFFEFDNALLVGFAPNGFELYGYKETEETILKYAEIFSKISFNSIDEWVMSHLIMMKHIYNGKNLI